MTAKEKAIKLCDKFAATLFNTEHAQECALICVEEIINNRSSDDSSYVDENGKGWDWDLYWQEVKEEISNL